MVQGNGIVIIDNAARFQVTEQLVTQRVFGSLRARTPYEHAALQLQGEIDLVEAAVDLSNVQRQKLELAGSGDIHRFLDDLDALQRDAPAGMLTQDQYVEIIQKLQPMQARFQVGLHGPNSLYRKTLRATLDEEQYAEYQRIQAGRNQKRYEAVVKAAVAMLDRKIPLTLEQREHLINRVLVNTTPPPGYLESQYQLYVVLYQMSKVPEAELRPIFTDKEWQAFKAVLAQGRIAEPLLRQAAAQLAV
jgi:hypothetical protein